MQPTPAHRSRRRLGLPLVVGLLASALSLVVAVPATPAHAADPGPTVTGDPCAPGVGVTVVIDYQQLGGGLEVGCAPGEQASGFTALSNAGFTINESGGPVAGTVCQVEGKPAFGYPGCWFDGFWGYWKSDGAEAWQWSDVGASSGPLAIDRVEGWSWTSPIPEDYAGAPMRLDVEDLDQLLLEPDCDAIPQLPTFDIVDADEVLPVTLADGFDVEVAVLADPDDDPDTATWTETDELALATSSGDTRVLARRAGNECPDGGTFDFTYDVRAAYAPRWNGTGDGSPSPALDRTDPSFVGWITGHSEYTPGGNVNLSFQVPANAYGPIDSTLVVLGDRGSYTATFGAPITNGDGYDFAAFENGFSSGANDFLEVAYVEVSSNGTDFVRFDSASRRTTTVTAFGTQSPAELGGLAGKDLANKGTPFDLSVLTNKAEVRSGAVDLDRITHVRLKDIQGDGNDLDSFGRPIYDPNPVTGSAGYDLTGIGVINARDEVAPVVDITDAPSGTTDATTAEISFTVDDQTATVERRLDDGDWVPATSPIALSDLADGPHELTVRATDETGNEGSDAASWTVDATGPTVTLTEVPDDPTTVTDATIGFEVDDAAAVVDYRLDGGEWITDVATPIELADLAAGDHEVELRATDAFDRTGTALVDWTVAPEMPADRAAALHWLADELADNDHGMPGFAPGTFDWGLTADAVLALAAGGEGDDAEVLATTAQLLDHTGDFATWDALGAEYEGVRIAGALGKLLLVAEVQGIDDPTDTDGFDLEAEVRSTMETTGEQQGRFSDIDPHFGSNGANGFGQALAMLGLSHTDDGVPTEAVSFLVRQQCPGGGFRLTYTGPACTDAASADADTTALAVQALLVVDRTPAVQRALLDGLGWLESRQDASGGWGGTGPTAGLNANSSGLITQTLRASGRSEPAAAGRAWVSAAALSPANVGTGPAADEVGAIAYTYATRDEAIANGIGASSRDQWRRSSAQAVLALDLPDYGSIERPPAEVVAEATTPTEAFVIAAYEDFLDRSPTESELAARVAQVGAAGRRAVLDELVRSDEWLGTIVTRFYRDTLDRDPDAGGLAFWTNALRSGRRTVAQAAAEFYASNEYFTNSGATVDGWLTDLYEKVLGRSPDAGGLAYWRGRTQARGRVFVAGQIYQSPESRRDRVTTLYGDLLGRAPDAAGLAFWSGRIQRSGDLALAVQLASSNEYATRAVARFP